jgi:general secretion pathway protein G
MSPSLKRRLSLTSDQGFTLIELLMVIIILGFLSAVVVFSVRGIADKGETSACKANFETAVTGSEAYYATNNGDPADLKAVVDGGFLHSDPSNTGKASVDVAGTAADPLPGTACD